MNDIMVTHKEVGVMHTFGTFFAIKYMYLMRHINSMLFIEGQKDRIGYDHLLVQFEVIFTCYPLTAV